MDGDDLKEEFKRINKSSRETIEQVEEIEDAVISLNLKDLISKTGIIIFQSNLLTKKELKAELERASSIMDIAVLLNKIKGSAECESSHAYYNQFQGMGI